MSTNPLNRYFRQPEIYISLPSKGRWWPKNSIVIPPNQEFGIASMTGADDLALKNADGLFNGDSTVKVIESCCPNIKDAWETPQIDLDVLFIAIRIASYGHQMDLSTKCAKCESEIDYAIDLRYVLENIKIPDYDTPLIINDLMIYLRPSSYKITNITNQEVYQQQKTIFALKDSTLGEEDKLKIINDALQKLTEMSVKRLYEFIDYIVTEDGSRVDNREFIKEFIENADRATFEKINQEIQKKSKEYLLPKSTIRCEACGHEDTRDLIFEPSSFFAQSS